MLAWVRFSKTANIFLRLYRQQNPQTDPLERQSIGLFALTYAGHFWQNLQFNKESLVLSFRLWGFIFMLTT